MNGARAEPWAKTISAPSNSKKIIIGASHHFLWCLRNSQNSNMIDNLLIYYISLDFCGIDLFFV